MKKILFVVVVSSLLLCAPQISRAASVTLVNPGLTPSHPLYSLDLATDWMQLNVLTVREDRQASQQLRIAEERLAEMKKLQDAQAMTPVYAHRLTSAYENALLAARRYHEEKLVKGEDVSEFEQELEERTERHVVVWENLFESTDDDAEEIRKRVDDGLELTEQEQDDLTEDALEEEDALSDDEGLSESRNKIQRANEEITRAEQEIAASEANGEDVSELRLMIARAKMFLGQAEAAQLKGEYLLSHALARQAKSIAHHARVGGTNDDTFDQTFEKGYEQVLHAEEKIREAEEKLAEENLDATRRAEAQALLDQAKAVLADAKTAMDQDEYVLGFLLAKQARSLAGDAKDLIEGDDDNEEEDEDEQEEETEVENIQEHAEEQINDAEEEIREAVLKIDERKREGDDVTVVTEFLFQAQEKLRSANASAAESDWIDAYTFARQAERLANDAKSGKFIEHADEDEEQELLESESSRTGQGASSDTGRGQSSETAGDDDSDDDADEDRETENDEERSEEQERIRGRLEEEKQRDEKIREDEKEYEEQQQDEEKRRREEQRKEEEQLREEQERAEEEREQEEEQREEEQRRLEEEQREQEDREELEESESEDEDSSGGEDEEDKEDENDDNSGGGGEDEDDEDSD